MKSPLRSTFYSKERIIPLEGVDDVQHRADFLTFVDCTRKSPLWLSDGRTTLRSPVSMTCDSFMRVLNGRPPGSEIFAFFYTMGDLTKGQGES
jgi:hypothetical protein